MSNKQMHPIAIDELMQKPQTVVDLYVQLSGEKFILVAKAGTNTSADHLQKFKKKGVTHLYVKPEDFYSLVQHSISVAGMAIGDKAIGNLTKLKAIDEALSTVHDEIREIGVDEQILSHAKMVTEATMLLISGNAGLSQLLLGVHNLPSEVNKHTMLVSMVAAMIGQFHEWVKPATLEKLALGGMLHDIGKLKLPPALISKDFMKMNHDEKVIYKSHPEVGRQMLSQVKSVPDDVVLIVYEHHERADGSGFPRGIKDFMTSPLARVVGLANAFADAALAGDEKAITKTSARRALEDLEYQRGAQFNKDALRALKRLIEDDAKKKAG